MRARIVVAAVVALLIASVAGAQFRRGRRGYSNRELRYATLEDFDGSFQFCRAVFRQASNGDGGNWSVDFPRADQNLSVRLSELTKTSVGLDDNGTPKHLLINLGAPELFHCPFIMMTEVGSVYLDDLEAAGLRDYLLKGGFLWADDFWGDYAWDVFEGQMRKVLPSTTYPFKELPIEHPMFHSLMPLKTLPQIPSINAWGGPGGPTSERGRSSATPHARAIVDEHGRVMVLATHNTDIGDSFEREGDSREYFLQFSVHGYALGVNVLLYAMTH
ncbi:MAG: DUF4159 domain-containing protein [Luteitalea sp.]|nr:DUF4159 domain-containing protein [Luteitalea sp.]